MEKKVSKVRKIWRKSIQYRKEEKMQITYERELSIFKNKTIFCGYSKIAKWALFVDGMSIKTGAVYLREYF